VAAPRRSDSNPPAKFRYKSLLLVVLTPCVLWYALRADAGGKEQPVAVKQGGQLKGTLKHLSASVAQEAETLNAGQTGTLKIRFSVTPPKDGQAKLTWDRLRGPLEVRASAPKTSGITFVGVKAKGAASRTRMGEALLHVPIPEGEPGVVEAKITYRVSSRVRVKNYALRLYVSAPLRRGGDRIQEAGIVSVPVRVETPLRTKVTVLIVIAVAIFLFVVEWVRVDVVAIMIMLSLPLLNLLNSKDTFNGLSSNAVVAIIGVMIVSAGLNKVGLVSRVVRPVIKLAGNSTNKLMVFLSVLIAMISSVMQNTGAAVLFLPGIQHACKEIKRPVSSILMPIGMCAILGGTMTMIGTSPLILLNDILPAGMEKFGLMELTPIGAGFVVGGIFYFSTFGKVFLNKIVKAQQTRTAGGLAAEPEPDVRTFYHDLDGPFELHVPMDYVPPRGAPRSVVGIRRERQVNMVAIADARGHIKITPSPNDNIQPGNNLCVYGPEPMVRNFSEKYGIEFLERPKRFRELFNPAVAGTVEAVVSPRSAMIGSTVKEIGFRKTFDVTVLGLYREGKVYYSEMSDIPLSAGDALLLHSSWEHFHVLQEAHRNITIITPLEVEIQKPSKATPAVFCFLVALTLMLVSSFYFQTRPYNPIPLSVCLMLGGLGMVLTRVMTIQEAYTAVDWRTVFLLGGLIPLGMAVDRTGTAEWIATGVVAALGDSVSPLILLIVLAVMAGAFCLVISNVGACTLLVPLGVSMASQIGIAPRVAAIVVGLGVSNSFLLPTHQVNALYMGPGGYKTKDYMRIGGVLSMIYVAILVTMTYFFYL
jgi:di/tricarboxylate transporter